MQRNIIIVLTLVVVAMGIVVGALAYNYKMLDESFSLCSNASIKLNNNYQDCIDKQKIEEEEKEVDKDQKISYSSTIVGDYRLYFEYPVKYSVLDTKAQWSRSDDRIYLSLITNQQDTDVADRYLNGTKYKFVQKAVPLIQFYSEAESYDGAPFGSPSVSVVKINGNEYQAKEYSFGETDGYNWDLHSEWTIIELEKDLYIKVLSLRDIHESFCLDIDDFSFGVDDSTPNCNYPRFFIDCRESCENYEPKKLYAFETSQEDIDNAYKILESLRWEKVK